MLNSSEPDQLPAKWRRWRRGGAASLLLIRQLTEQDKESWAGSSRIAGRGGAGRPSYTSHTLSAVPLYLARKAGLGGRKVRIVNRKELDFKVIRSVFLL